MNKIKAEDTNIKKVPYCRNARHIHGDVKKNKEYRHSQANWFVEVVMSRPKSFPIESTNKIDDDLFKGFAVDTGRSQPRNGRLCLIMMMMIDAVNMYAVPLSKTVIRLSITER